MNKQTRTELARIIEGLERLQSVVQDAEYEDMPYLERLGTLVSVEDEISDYQSQIGEFQSEEQDKFDNLSEGLQASEKGEAISAAADALSYASDECDDVLSEIREVHAEIKSYNDKSIEGMTLDDVTDKAQEISDAIQSVIDYLEEAAQ